MHQRFEATFPSHSPLRPPVNRNLAVRRSAVLQYTPKRLEQADALLLILKVFRFQPHVQRHWCSPSSRVLRLAEPREAGRTVLDGGATAAGPRNGHPAAGPALNQY